jgi:hypothetical protein
MRFPSEKPLKNGKYMCPKDIARAGKVCYDEQEKPRTGTDGGILWKKF